MLASQRGGHVRAAEVARLEAELLTTCADPALAHPPELLARRGGAFYSEAAVDLMAALYADTGSVQVVDVRNNGALPGLALHDVVEVPARIDRTGPHPLPLAPLAPDLLDLVVRVKPYERLAAVAAATVDRVLALEALRANPLVAVDVAAPLLAALLEAEDARRGH
jgi:6-phospho-beta-glucosidase